MNGRKILLVDDHADNRDVYAIILEYFGYEVLTAHDGWDGVQQARRCHPDVILMDISMPVLDGLQATELLKHDSETCDIPVIAVSAHDDPSMIARSRAAGVDGYLIKPTTPVRVLEEIERCLELPTSSLGVERFGTGENSFPAAHHEAADESEALSDASDPV